MPLCRSSVKYLSQDITSEGHALSKDRIEATKSLPKPVTKQHMMSLLGVAGYCRPWLKDYEETVQPLQDCISNKTLFVTCQDIHGRKM